VNRDDGFTVMDVSVDIVIDPKVRKLYRHAPDHAGAAFIAYVAVVAESWREGRRVGIDDAWPAVIPFDRIAVDALYHVGLIDKKGCVRSKAWRNWFEKARARRFKSRERWARYNAKREADTALEPRGDDVGTATSVPPVPPVPPKGLYDAESKPRARAKSPTNGPMNPVEEGR
jgi:hypothetical protein